jgi:acetyl esterase/lipase
MMMSHHRGRAMHRNHWARRITAAVLTTLALLAASCTKQDIEWASVLCPEDPGADSVPFLVDVGRPVFWGFQDVGPDDGATRSMRIFYPSHDGSPPGAPVLKHCLQRWPIVLFLHGQPPEGVTSTNYHQSWEFPAAMLARAGYVVLVPSHSADLPQNDSFPGIQEALDDIAWVRTHWEDAKWVDPTATAVVGHSYGAVLAARAAAASSEVGALVSLSGPYAELGDRVALLRTAGPPALLMWAEGDSLGHALEDLDQGGVWDQLAGPKYAIEFAGEHFDYLRLSTDASVPRGSCLGLDVLAAEIATLFVARFVPVTLGRTEVPVDLRAPSLSLTDEERFFSGASWLQYQDHAPTPDCPLDVRWDADGEVGSRSR